MLVGLVGLLSAHPQPTSTRRGNLSGCPQRGLAEESSACSSRRTTHHPSRGDMNASRHGRRWKCKFPSHLRRRGSAGRIPTPRTGGRTSHVATADGRCREAVLQHTTDNRRRLGQRGGQEDSHTHPDADQTQTPPPPPPPGCNPGLRSTRSATLWASLLILAHYFPFRLPAATRYISNNVPPSPLPVYIHSAIFPLGHLACLTRCSPSSLV